MDNQIFIVFLFIKIPSIFPDFSHPPRSLLPASSSVSSHDLPLKKEREDALKAYRRAICHRTVHIFAARKTFTKYASPTAGTT
ncbi:MAG: hypothetical protein ACLVDZ_10550 [Ruminococcus sp.]